MATEVTPKEIRHQNVRYKYVDGGAIYGYVKDRSVEVPERFPWISWKGEPMPYELYQKILRFFEWSQHEHKSEALVYLYYSEREKAWMAWAPPQESRGMTVKSKEDHANFKQANDFTGFIKIGTAHHHCTASAFQSGTDRDDECTGNGLHYTIGKLDEAVVDYHFRAVFNGNMQQVDPYYWIGLPPHLEKAVELAPELTGEAYKKALSSHAPKEMEVPEIWKENFFPYTYQASSGFHTGSDYSPGSTWNPVTKKWEKWGSGGVGANGAVSTPHQPDLSVRAAQASEPTSERHGGISNEDMADLEISQLSHTHNLGASELYRIAAAIGNHHYRTNLPGEDQIEKVLEKYGFGGDWLRAWIEENDNWADYQGV